MSLPPRPPISEVSVGCTYYGRIFPGLWHVFSYLLSFSYRLTVLRKNSSNSDSNLQLASSRLDLSSSTTVGAEKGGEKGTIHTKRHAGSQDPIGEQQREK